MPVRDKYALDTPCLVLDLDVLEASLRRMQTAVGAAGKQLRPHAKTHKCSALALRQIEAGAVGICAAKVSEAEALAAAGVRGQLLTGPVAAPAKFGRLAALRAADPDLMAAVDSPAGIQALDAAMRAAGLRLDVLLDLDVGLHRTGVRPEAAAALAAVIAGCPGLRLRGVQAYAGHVQHIRGHAQRRAASLGCLRQAAEVFRGLRSQLPDCTVFSASGTGTFDIDLEVAELTELQAGSYVCMDTDYLAIGSPDDPEAFTAFQPAMRVLTTVVSRNQAGFATVDAGLKALYRDGGRPLVLGPDGAGLTYDWFGDEYGRVGANDPAAVPDLGAVLELVASHCDPTVNLYDRFFLTRGSEVVGEWPIDLRGCSQ